ncbi:MAG: hypothetical protein Q9187_004392 [Circinaria calcarea]
MEVPGTYVKAVLHNSPISSHALRARTISKQLALGLAHLHECNVACGNLTIFGVHYTAQDHRGLGEHEILDLLGQPKTIPVSRHDGKSLSPQIPRYTVVPTEFPGSEGEIRISAFSKAFLFDEKPQEINVPKSQQAPELAFAKDPSEWDYRVDLWRLGATICDTFTARSPYLARGSNKDNPKWCMTRAVFKPPQAELGFLGNVSGGGMSETELSGLIDIVESLMAMDPKGRKSATEVAEHLFLNPA